VIEASIMKQLVQTFLYDRSSDSSSSYVILGLHNCAVVIDTSRGVRWELEAPPPPPATSSDEEAALDASDDIQAVAVTRTVSSSSLSLSTSGGNDEIWFAVARQNKTLALYCIFSCDDTNLPAAVVTSIPPTTVHKTDKRTSCLSFTRLDEEEAGTAALHFIIAGDLAGDAVAFPLRVAAAPKQQQPDDRHHEQDIEDRTRGRRLLLGHTASMLTGMHVMSNRILTSDRDEKIRVSAFPETFIIHGYLLGHEAFVSWFDVHETTNRCISGSGDGSIRLWDLSSYSEMACLDDIHEDSCMGRRDDNDDEEENDNALATTSLLPTCVLFNRTGNMALAIYDESIFLDVFGINDHGTLLTHSCRIECSAQPLALALLDHDRVLIVAKEPTYLQLYQFVAPPATEDQRSALLLEPAKLVTTCDWVSELRSFAASRAVAMPVSVLERDKHGALKMLKLNETRGPSMPWDNGTRVDIARERNRRGNSNRRKKQRIGGGLASVPRPMETTRTLSD
jgi:hypothetical protein